MDKIGEALMRYFQDPSHLPPELEGAAERSDTKDKYEMAIEAVSKTTEIETTTTEQDHETKQEERQKP
jgi:hypothetical protein